MWKPGSSKPGSRNSKEKQKGSSDSLHIPNAPLPTPPSATKKLSGATMNMRFMKRKAERHEQTQRRQSGASPGGSSQLSSPLVQRKLEASPPGAPGNPIDKDDGMDVDTPENGSGMTSSASQPYAPATSIDMYGMQASLIGRRSFGGFNAAMEEAWKDSKASFENRLEKPKQKISDEELIKRYQDIVKKRSESSRPVGNLQEKTKRRKKQ